MSAPVEDPVLISVVVPVYNHERYVRFTIESVIDQTYPALELIIVDDGSPDRTAEVICDLEPECRRRFQRFELIRQTNQGVGAALNRGLRAAASEFVYLLSSDDLSVPDAIATLFAAMIRDADVGVAAGDASFIDAEGRETTRERAGRHFSSLVRFATAERTDISLPSDYGTYASLLGGNYVSPGILVKRSVLERVGLYDPKVHLEDWTMWLKLAKICRFVWVDRPLCRYRVHDANTVQTQVVPLVGDLMQLFFQEAEYAITHGYGAIWKTKIEGTFASYCAIRDQAVAAERARLTAERDRLALEVQLLRSGDRE